ncbi:hypothetical protein J7K24_02245 [bacterium]|nr:hypothetical protein [bacterium]
MQEWLNLLVVSILVYLIGVIIVALLAQHVDRFYLDIKKDLGEDESEEENKERLISWKLIICWPIAVIIWTIVFVVLFLIVILVAGITHSEVEDLIWW